MKRPGNVALVSLAGMVLISGPASAYFHIIIGSSPFHRPDFAGIQYQMDPTVKVGLRSTLGTQVFESASNPLAALEAAQNTWGSVASAKVHFNPVVIAPTVLQFCDGINVFSFADSDELRSIIGDAIAVTVPCTTLGAQVHDADTLFNANYQFSTNVAPGTMDLQSIATHELGHSLGAAHSPLYSATMYPYIDYETTFLRRLSADDIAFVTDSYPVNNIAASLGSIVGKVTFPSGKAVRGASVIAIDPASGVAVGSASREDGSCSINRLPPGSYMVFAEPLNDTASVADIGFDGPADLDWTPAFAGGSATPATFKVIAGDTARADIPAGDGPAAVHIDSFGPSLTDAIYPFLDPSSIPSGQGIDLFFTGHGFDETIRPEDVLLLGPGLSLRADSLLPFPGDKPDDPSALLLTIDVAPRTDWSLAVVAIRKGAAMAPYAAFRIMPAGPTFKPSDTVNAASYLNGAIAPGEIVTLFGVGLGPRDGVGATGFDPVTGNQPVGLGDVSVKIDGVAAPLYYVSSTQINLQAPYETSGRKQSSIAVTYQGATSEPVLVPVAAASPAFFGDFGVAAFNQDGTLNSYDNPAARGSVVTVFGTGQGNVSPALATGQPASGDSLSRVASATAKVDGVPASISFAGMAPGFAGLLQVNLTIPDTAKAGDSVPIEITIDGIKSPSGAFLSVK